MIFRKLHSIKICLTLTCNSWSPSHWSHNGGWGLFSILNEYVNREWPIRRRLIITSSFFVYASWVILVINLRHDSVQFVTKLFIPPFLPQNETKGWILIKTSVHGSTKCTGFAFDKTSFAARSASSFPVISQWLGIQQKVMNLPLDNISWRVCKTLFTRGFLLSWLSMACNTDMLSAKITKRSIEETFT